MTMPTPMQSTKMTHNSSLTKAGKARPKIMAAKPVETDCTAQDKQKEKKKEKRKKKERKKRTRKRHAQHRSVETADERQCENEGDANFTSQYHTPTLTLLLMHFYTHQSGNRPEEQGMQGHLAPTDSLCLQPGQGVATNIVSQHNSPYTCAVSEQGCKTGRLVGRSFFLLVWLDKSQTHSCDTGLSGI